MGAYQGLECGEMQAIIDARHGSRSLFTARKQVAGRGRETSLISVDFGPP